MIMRSLDDEFQKAYGYLIFSNESDSETEYKIWHQNNRDGHRDYEFAVCQLHKQTEAALEKANHMQQHDDDADAEASEEKNG